MAEVRASLPTGGDASGLASELFAVGDLLRAQRALRNVLADSGSPASVRRAIASDTLGAQLSDAANSVLGDVVGADWSNEHDLLTALSTLAAQALLAHADADGSLPTVEEELFRVRTALDTSPELALLLTDPSATPQTKTAVLDDLLARAHPSTRLLLTRLLSDLDGRAPADVVAELSAAAAAQRDQVVATVRAAVPISDAQRMRLVTALTRSVGRAVRLNLVPDPSVIGGLVVTVGDEVIDGSTAARLEQAHRAVSA